MTLNIVFLIGFTFLCGTSLGIYTASLFLRLKRQKVDNRDKERRKLVEALIRARTQRMRWLLNHSNMRNPFEHPFYHVLWEQEIGAEEILHVFFPKKRRRLWRQYHAEQKDCAKRAEDGL